MAIFIIDEPFEVNWSRNQVRYGIHTDTTLDTPGLVLEVKLRYRSRDDLFRDIVTQSLTPDENGNIFLDVSFILDSLLTYQLPEITNNAVQQIINQSGDFYIDYREITSSNNAPSWISTVDKVRKVIKGGLSYESWSGGNFFTQYIPVEKIFLTWQPTGYLSAASEQLYLHYLSTSAIDDQVTARIKIHFADSSEDNSKIINVGSAGIAKYDIYCIPAGCDQLQLQQVAPEKIIQWWEIAIYNGSTILAGPYRYVLDYRYYGDEIQFNFFNSLGGIDSIRIRGNWEIQHTRDTAEIERISDAYYYNTNELPAMVDDAVLKERITWKGDAGYMSRIQQDRYRELLLSRKRVALIRDRWINARILNKSTSLYNKGEQMTSLPLEWAFSYDNISYTPSNVDFGSLNVPAMPPYNIRITAVNLNTHTLEWDSDSALAFSIQGEYFDEAKGTFVDNNPSPFKRTAQANILELGLAKFRHAKLKILAYGSGYISKLSSELIFPLLNPISCPLVSNIHLIGWVGNNVTIAWDGAAAHKSFELICTFSNNSDSGPLAPPIGWDNIYVNTNSAVINTNTFRKLDVKIRANCLGTESPISNTFTTNKP